MKKFYYLLILFLLITSTACAQLLIDANGFAREEVQFGKRGAKIKYDRDSSAYKVKFIKDGNLDSAWIALSKYAYGPNKISFIVEQIDTINGRVSSAEASIVLKANRDSMNAIVDSIYALLNLKADITLIPDSATTAALYAAINAKASVTLVNALGDTLDTVAAGLIAEAGNRIAGDSVLTASLFLYALRDSLVSYINVLPELIKIKSSIIEIDGQLIADSLRGKSIVGNGSFTIDAYGGLNLKSTSSSRTINLEALWINATTTLFDINGTLQVDSIDMYPSKISGFQSAVWSAMANYPGGFVTGTPWTSMGYITDGNTGWDNSYGFITGVDSAMVMSAIGYAGYIPGFGSAVNSAIYNYSSTTGGGLATQSWVNSQGYITDGNSGWDNLYGFITSESDPTIYAWAKASTKPSYTFSEIGSKPTTLSGYGITDAASSSHNHTGVYSAVGHAHAVGDITSGYAGDIPGFVSAVNSAIYNYSSTTGGGLATQSWVSTNYSATSHTHDSRYYTESEIDTLLSGKANTWSGYTGTISFTDNEGNDQRIYVSNGIITNWETL